MQRRQLRLGRAHVAFRLRTPLEPTGRRLLLRRRHRGLGGLHSAFERRASGGRLLGRRRLGRQHSSHFVACDLARLIRRAPRVLHLRPHRLEHRLRLRALRRHLGTERCVERLVPLALTLELLKDGLHLVRLGAAQGAQLGRESFGTLARRRAERLLHHLLVLEPLERIVALGGHLGHLLGVPSRLFLGGRAVLLRTRKLLPKHGHLPRLLLERELGRIAPLLELHVLCLRRRQRAARCRRRRRRRRAALPKHVARVRCLTSGRLECGTRKQKPESKLRRPCPLVLSGHARGHRSHRLRGATRHRRPCERPTRLVEL